MVFNDLGNSHCCFSYITPSSDQDIDETTFGKLLTEAHREHADYRSPESVSVNQSSLSVVFDRTGKPAGERNVDQSIGFGVTRNTYSACSKFSENTQAEKVVDRTGKPSGESSSNAHIRTLLDEQRQMIIAENCEKIGHHELQAARAEEESRSLRKELWRQKLVFREVHQQNFTEMEELRKFLNSTFDAFGIHMTWYIGKRFCKSTCIFINSLSSGIESMGDNIEEPLHMSTAEKSERPEQNRDLRCQSGPSTKDSVIFSGGDSSKNFGADQQRLQISDLHFDKFPTPATFACWKIRFKTEVCTCSQFPTEAMKWIKEVELVDSVDDLRSSSSIRSIPMPDFEVLDARIASALNKIIHNSQFKRRISLEEQKSPERGPFPSRQTDCLLDLRFLPCHWNPRFCRKLHRPVHYCSSK